MTFVLTGLDIEAKADLTVRSLSDALGGTGQFAEFDARLIRTDKPDAPTNAEATAQLRVTVKDEDADRVGRRFSGAATELALAGYPGLHLTAPPGDAAAYGVYWPALVPADLVVPSVVPPRRARVDVPHHGHRATDGPLVVEAGEASLAPGVTVAPDTAAPAPAGRTRRTGAPCDCRSAPSSAPGRATRGATPTWDCGRAPATAWAWLDAELTLDRFRQLLPEADGLVVQRHAFPNLYALNFVVVGLLGEGVASSTRPDPQAKGLGEYLRSRVVDLPVSLVPDPS